MQVQESVPWLKEYIDPVNSALEELVGRKGSTGLENAVADALSAGGKRVRATLALLWCEVYSGDCKPAVPLAVAYELAHASALVQDDIIDHSSMRRGKESIGAKYGLTTAILASDLLLFNVPKMVASYADMESWRLAKVFDYVGEACRATTWGEFMDAEMARGEEVTAEAYEEMIRLKTSSLLSAPCASGALVGGASEEQVGFATRYGEELGLAYQIQDDTLDLVGEESSLGKPVFTDLRGGKRGLVLIHCLGGCSVEERNFVSSLLNRSGVYSQEEKSRLKALIDRYGSRDYARKEVLRHTNSARDVLRSLPENNARSRLFELTDYLAGRYY